MLIIVKIILLYCVSKLAFILSENFVPLKSGIEISTGAKMPKISYSISKNTLVKILIAKTSINKKVYNATFLLLTNILFLMPCKQYINNIEKEKVIKIFSESKLLKLNTTPQYTT